MRTKQIALALVTVIVLSTAFATCAGGESDAAEVGEPTISEAGYASDSKPFFYYAKFAISGFPYTSGSVSGDTPGKGVGLNISDNTLFATLNGLDVGREYYLFISEYGSADKSEPDAVLCIGIGSGMVHCGVWVSLLGDTQAYVNGAAAESAMRSGGFSESVDGKVYRFELTDEDSATPASASLPDGSNVVSSMELADAENYTAIADFGVFTSDEALINMAAHGVRICVAVFPLIGAQMVIGNFFQSIGKAKVSIFMSLTRQLIYLLPGLVLLPPHFGLDGIWMSMPISDLFAFVTAAAILWWYIRKLKRQHREATAQSL